MGATRPFREAGEMWCGKNSTAAPASAQCHEHDSDHHEHRASDDPQVPVRRIGRLTPRSIAGHPRLRRALRGRALSEEAHHLLKIAPHLALRLRLPEEAEPLYEHFCAALRREGIQVAQGVFGARMEVALVNDGPVTIVLDT